MGNNLRLRPILASVLVLAFARGTFAVETQTAKDGVFSDSMVTTPALLSEASNVESNYWVRPPSLSKTAWRVGEAPAEVDSGKPYLGTPVVTYSNRLESAALMTEIPTRKGEYAALFTVAETHEHTGLQTSINFSITSGVDLNRGYSSVYDYVSKTVLTIDGYNGQETLVDFPMYVTIKNGSPSGFSYDDLKHWPDRTKVPDDFQFFDSTGKALEFEVAKWDPNGESSFWLRVPLVYKGATVTLCWNLRDGCELPTHGPAKDVWADFVGVWHMDEEILTGAQAATNLSYDVTGHGLDAMPFPGAKESSSASNTLSAAGVFGLSRVSETSSRSGSFLAVPDVDGQLNLGDTFTVSFWLKVDTYDNSTPPQIINRRQEGSTKSDVQNGYQIELNKNHQDLTIRGRGRTPEPSVHVSDVDVGGKRQPFYHFAVAYEGSSAYVYANGELKGTATINPVNDVPGDWMCFGNTRDGVARSLAGKFDEVRLSKGARSEGWMAAEYAQWSGSGKTFYTAGAVTTDPTGLLQNSWLREPSMSKTTWEADEPPPTLADFDLGEPYGEPSRGTQTLVFYNRATGEKLGETVPTKVGDYRAVVSVAATGGWGALEYTINFRIVSRQTTHALGLNYHRILLANDDYSVDGGEVWDQNYDAEADDLGLPFWRHQDENGGDASTTGAYYWSDSLLFNLGGGSHHAYYDGNTNRLWDLRDVRLGNTFNNGELLEEELGKVEEWDEGLAADQNYLSWNPLSQRLIDGWSQTVGPCHRYAGQVVMQNTLDAAITSPCYADGIGTIYFDAVNGWTDNVTNEFGEASYELIVEVATNAVDSTDAPTDARVDSKSGDRVLRAAEYADWRRVPIHVLRFDGASCRDFGTHGALTMDIADGGSYECFYRVFVPVKVHVPARFRIRRTAIDTTQSFNPDALAYILVDNVICSSPAVCANLEPYGHYDASKTGKRKLGCEGAFVPAFPSSQDTAVRGRAKVRMSDGSTYPGSGISSATMHYRWHYIEQRTSAWLLADLDPASLVSVRPLDLPLYEGDIDFWFELNQNLPFYAYADYSGRVDASGKPLGLGDADYSEELASVTNRAAGADWFVRTRDGRSPYAEARVLIKTSERDPVQTVDMTVVDNQTWRGFFRMTSVLKDGFQWRIELLDRQDDGATSWMASTNCLYVKDWTSTLPEFPAAARLSEGSTNNWSRMPCDMRTGYLAFQFDERTYGVTVVHADYQDFNSWNDAGNGYFTGSSSETNKMSGTSASVRTYDERYAGWADESATNANWSAIFDGKVGYAPFAPGYKTFLANSENGTAWDLGKGMWVHEFYRDANSRVAFQMAGGGEGYMEFKDKTQLGEESWPRGFESVSFNARIAQKVSPENMASLGDGGARLTNYTFMARTCFDMNQNMNFAGNASVSLFAYYRPGKGTYEARWEQVAGVAEDNAYYKGLMTGPQPRGQRLVISRWDRVGMGYAETVLIAVTNSATMEANMPLMPFDSYTLTNNLMPFCISVYQREDANTVILAGVRVAVSEERVRDGKKAGVSWNTPLTDMQDQWFFACAIDAPETALKSGSYGVLSANCEGLFLTPQFRNGISYPSDVQPKDLKRGYYGGRGARKNLNAVSGYVSCHADIADDWWDVDPGREQAFFGSSSAQAHGFSCVALDQTVDIYAKPMGTDGPSGDWTYIDSVWLDGFGKPGRAVGYADSLWYPSDSALRLQTGGDYDGYHVDVVIADVSLRQWRGRDNWSTSEADWNWKTDKRRTSNDFGYTNVVFTSGWTTDGAVRLSAKRAVLAERSDNRAACSVRSPLFDGYSGRGEGLGKLSIRYRQPTSNIRLLVQVVTNYTSAAGNLSQKSRVYEDGDGNGTWQTIASVGYRELWSDNPDDARDGTKSWGMSLGLHGAKGMMRIVIDNELVREVAGESDPSQFGEIDIVEALFKDEPSLSKGCWWGWNLQTVGDPGDTQRRMYLPDSADDLQGAGQSLALNNSVADGVNPAEDAEDFRKHLPFLQSPTFTNGVIGQLTFKARKYDLSDGSPAAKVVVYGADESLSGEDWSRDDMWTFVAEFPVTNTVYTTYRYKTDGQKFKAMRLAVVDVDGTENPPREPKRGAAPQRVLLDEVMVSEAVRAMLSFRNVGAFRSQLEDDHDVPDVPSADEQPLCGENWGVQAEVFATLLEGEIDPTVAPKVKLHWYVGKDRWGYENWKDVPAGATDAHGARIRGSAYLAQTDSSNYVYRSSYKTSPEAVLPAQNEANTVVQYMLEVEYMVVNSATGASLPATNWLDSASWSTPEWYAPIDFNADPDYGADKTFAGYTILDKVAPGWAWINEANVYGTRTKMGGNTEEQFQFVEVCVPAEADLSGWRIRMLDYVNDHQVTTNWVAKFGPASYDTAPGQKPGNVGMRYNKVFRSIGNKESEDLSKEKGTLDGVWTFSTLSNTFKYRDKTYYVHDMEMPFGIQLLRPSGIIEHSIVIVGTDDLGSLPGWQSYNPTNIAAKLNRLVPGSKFFYAAEDCCGEKRTGSVMSGRGESPSVWTNNWVATPGNLNQAVDGTEQVIDMHPTPHGDTIIVFATVDTSLGHVTQYVGGKGSTATNISEMITLPRGGGGTNILYRVDPWYELRGVTTNNASAWPYAPRVREQSVLVGAGASNNVTVVASAQVDSMLRGYGLTEDNPYTPAVMDWLDKGKDARGNRFAHPGEIALADVMDMRDVVVTNLSLTQMYWLDMDPTVSNLVLKGGFPKPPWEQPRGDLTNVKMTVFMMISNRQDHTAWSPYILRGLDPRFTSWQYDTTNSTVQAWTSETFKVTGILANGKLGRVSLDSWIPLRWFVFHEDSFYQPSDEPDHPRFTADIEIVDPHAIASPGAAAGWYEWFQEHGRDAAPVYHWWSIDTRLKPIAPEVLKKESFYR